MRQEVIEFKEYLSKNSYPKDLINVDTAWASSQAEGVPRKILENFKIIREYINAKRKLATVQLKQ